MKNNIKYFMNKFAISELELAQAINVDRSAIYRLTHGITKNPHIGTIEKIANFLKIDIKELISDSIDYQQNNISYKLKAFMQIQGKKLSDIHNDTGISRSVLNNILNNATSKPHINTLKTLANYFNVTVDQFFNTQISISENITNTLPVVQFNKIALYIKNPTKYIQKYFNIDSVVKVKNGLIAIIKDNSFYPIYIEPCSLVVAKIQPEQNQHIVVVSYNNANIYKFLKLDNGLIKLTAINDYSQSINITEEIFFSGFVGVIIEQIIGSV